MNIPKSQEHLKEHYNTLTSTEKELFEKQIENINFEHIGKLTTLLQNGQPVPEGNLQPPELTTEVTPEAQRKGEDAIKNGELALLLVAGGQGTRLGHDGPKGTYPASPVREKTLFQLIAHTMQSYQEKYQVTFPLYIMTSSLNDKATKAYFKEHISGIDVHFFIQDELPAVDPQGKIMIKSRTELSFSPDGTGSIYDKLQETGIVQELQKQGIKYVSYFQVDNALAHFIDAKFLGEHIAQNAEMSTKVVEKTYAKEKVGLVAKRDGRTCLVEYSVMPKEEQEKVDENGKLLYRAGNIALHIINTEFIKKMQKELPFYLAHKKIPFLKDGETHTPEEKNGYKFERFVFDALPFAKKSVTYLVKREEEFAPVKNATGKDSPATSKELQSEKYKKWLEAAGYTVDEHILVEISPCFAHGPEDIPSDLTLPKGHIYLSKKF